MVLGIEISTTAFIALLSVELIIGFLIGFFILSRAFKWALISIIVIAVLSYFGLIHINWDGFADAFDWSAIKSLLMLISFPLAIGMFIGWIVAKIF